MRFKARISNAGDCIHLYRVVQTYAKISRSRTCRLRLSPTKLYLSTVTETLDNDGVRVWSEIQQTKIFEAYRIESLHENNEILMELNLDQLARALKSALTASELVMKLTKSNDSIYLHMTISMQSTTGLVRAVCQEVPVLVLPHEEIAATIAPELPVPEVNIYLPNLRIVRNVVDRMKSLNDHMIISANNIGELTFQVKTSSVSIKTYFRHLENAQWREGEEPVEMLASSQQAAAEQLQARISIRAMFQFLNAYHTYYQNTGESVLLSIARDNAVILFLWQEEMSITFYVPVTSE